MRILLKYRFAGVVQSSSRQFLRHTLSRLHFHPLMLNNSVKSGGSLLSRFDQLSFLLRDSWKRYSLVHLYISFEIQGRIQKEKNIHVHIAVFIVIKSAQLNSQVPFNFTYFQDYNEIKTCFPVFILMIKRRISC